MKLLVQGISKFEAIVECKSNNQDADFNQVKHDDENTDLSDPINIDFPRRHIIALRQLLNDGVTDGEIL